MNVAGAGPATETEETQDQESVTKDSQPKAPGGNAPRKTEKWVLPQTKEQIKSKVRKSKLALKVVDKRELGLEQDNAG